MLTNAELKRHIVSVIGQWFALTSIQIAVAVLVAILRIINTLTVSISDRRRELASFERLAPARQLRARSGSRPSALPRSA